MTTKEEYFKVIREKKDLEKQFEVVDRIYHDTTMWEGDEEEVAEELLIMDKLRGDIQEKREVLAEMRKSFTKPELREMRKEFYGESN